MSEVPLYAIHPIGATFTEGAYRHEVPEKKTFNTTSSGQADIHEKSVEGMVRRTASEARRAASPQLTQPGRFVPGTSKRTTRKARN